MFEHREPNWIERMVDEHPRIAMAVMFLGAWAFVVVGIVALVKADS